MCRIKYCKVDTASTDSPFPKRCRAKLPPHEETKSIECNAMAEKISSYSLPPIRGATSSAASMLPVQTGKASLRKSLRFHPHARHPMRQSRCDNCASRKSNSAKNLQGRTSHGINTSMMKDSPRRSGSHAFLGVSYGWMLLRN